MKISKLLSLLLCATLSVCAFAGCGGGDKKDSGTVVDDLKYDEYGDPIFDDVQLKVWSIIGDPDNFYLDKVNTMFNDYYSQNGLSAKVVSIANAEFYTQLANTINTDPDNAPDMVIIHSERLTKLANDKILLPMDDYFTAAKSNFNENNYLANVMKECKYNGKIYGVPLDVHAGVWYVRSDILEKNGLEKPTDMQSFVDCCNALVDKYNKGQLWHRAADKTAPEKCVWTTTKDFGESYNPVVMSSEGGIETGWIPQTAVLQNGGKITAANGGPAWNTDGLKDVMQVLRDWQTGSGDFNGTAYKGAFVSEDNNYNTTWSKLSSGEAVFSCEGSWWIESRLNEYEAILGSLEDPDGKTYKPLDIMNMSKLYALDSTASYASSVYGVGHCFSICKNVTSKAKLAASALYAKYMTENSVDYTQGGHIPACKSVLESEQYTSKDYYKRYLSKMGNPEDFVMLGGAPNYTAVYEQLKLVYADVFTASKKNQAVSLLVDTRYNEAVRMIGSIEDL